MQLIAPIFAIAPAILILPAAAWYLTDSSVSDVALYERNIRYAKEKKYRSAEGAAYKRESGAKGQVHIAATAKM